MRKRIISAVIGGLMGPVAGLCTAMDIAVIRNIALVRSAVAEGHRRRRYRALQIGPSGKHRRYVAEVECRSMRSRSWTR
jgi:hypothetical protein